MPFNPSRSYSTGTPELSHRAPNFAQWSPPPFQTMSLDSNSISAGQNVNINTAGRDVIIHNDAATDDAKLKGAFSNILPNENDAYDRAVERRAILHWLSEINFKAVQKDTFSKVAAGTGNWLLRDRRFCDWMDHGAGVFWGVGIAGSGKTFLSSFIVNEFQRRARTSGDLAVIFAFCRFEENYSEIDILTSLLRQLAESSQSVYQTVKDELFIPSQQDEVNPSRSDILEAINNSVTTFRRTVIVIDALDELTEGVRRDLLSTLSCLPVSVLLTSRPLGLLDEMTPDLEIYPDREEMKSFIRTALLRLPKLGGKLEARGEVLQEVVRHIEKKSKGMFLLARLQLDALKNTMTINKLLDNAKNLPTTISDMYKLTLKRVEDQSEEEKNTAYQALIWVTHSRRPLKVKELCFALAAVPSCRSLDIDDLVSESTLLSICYGLISIERESDMVRLSHYTAHEFFVSYINAPFNVSHQFIADSCASYLSLFTSGGRKWPQSPEELKTFRLSKDLWSYACIYLGYHLNIVATQDPSRQLPSNSMKLLLHSRSLPLPTTEAGYRWCDYGSGAHFAAMHGIVRAYRGIQHSLSEESRAGITPLMYAAGNGHLAIIKYLIEDGKVNINQMGIQGASSALGRACVRGHISVVAYLLRHPHIDVNVNHRGVSLLHAIVQHSPRSSQLDILNLFLNHPSITLDVTDSSGRTVIHYVAEYGADMGVLDLLLQTCSRTYNRSYVTVQDYNGLTAYSIAKDKNRHGICERLASFEGQQIPNLPLPMASTSPYSDPYVRPERAVPARSGSISQNP